MNLKKLKIMANNKIKVFPNGNVNLEVQNLVVISSLGHLSSEWLKSIRAINNNRFAENVVHVPASRLIMAESNNYLLKKDFMKVVRNNNKSCTLLYLLQNDTTLSKEEVPELSPAAASLFHSIALLPHENAKIVVYAEEKFHQIETIGHYMNVHAPGIGFHKTQEMTMAHVKKLITQDSSAYEMDLRLADHRHNAQVNQSLLS